MMTEARHYDRKASLTPEEKLRAAYLHLIRGIAQHVLADVFDVNAGRIAEAVADVRKALNWEKPHAG